MRGRTCAVVIGFLPVPQSISTGTEAQFRSFKTVCVAKKNVCVCVYTKYNILGGGFFCA